MERLYGTNEIPAVAQNALPVVDRNQNSGQVYAVCKAWCGLWLETVLKIETTNV